MRRWTAGLRSALLAPASCDIGGRVLLSCGLVVLWWLLWFSWWFWGRPLRGRAVVLRTEPPSASRPCGLSSLAQLHPACGGRSSPFSARKRARNGAKAPLVPLCAVWCGRVGGGRVLRAALASRPVGATFPPSKQASVTPARKGRPFGPGFALSCRLPLKTTGQKLGK